MVYVERIPRAHRIGAIPELNPIKNMPDFAGFLVERFFNEECVVAYVLRSTRFTCDSVRRWRLTAKYKVDGRDGVETRRLAKPCCLFLGWCRGELTLPTSRVREGGAAEDKQQFFEAAPEGDPPRFAVALPAQVAAQSS